MHRDDTPHLCRSRAPDLDPFVIGLPLVVQEHLLLIRSGAGAPELQNGQQSHDREGQALALRLSRPSPFIVGRGPSHATRACERAPLATQRSRGTGPRATVRLERSRETGPRATGKAPDIYITPTSAAECHATGP